MEIDCEKPLFKPIPKSEDLTKRKMQLMPMWFFRSKRRSHFENERIDDYIYRCFYPIIIGVSIMLAFIICVHLIWLQTTFRQSHYEVYLKEKSFNKTSLHPNFQKSFDGVPVGVSRHPNKTSEHTKYKPAHDLNDYKPPKDEGGVKFQEIVTRYMFPKKKNMKQIKSVHDLKVAQKDSKDKSVEY